MKHFVRAVLCLAVLFFSCYFLDRLTAPIQSYIFYRLNRNPVFFSLFIGFLSVGIACLVYRWRIRRDKLVNLLFFSLILAFIASIIVLFPVNSLLNFVSQRLPVPPEHSTGMDIDEWIYMGELYKDKRIALGAVADLLLILPFPVVFSLLVRGRLRALQEIADKVDRVETMLSVTGSDELTTLSKRVNRMHEALLRRQEEENRRVDLQNRRIAAISRDLRARLDENPDDEALKRDLARLCDYIDLSRSDYPLHLETADFAAFLRDLAQAQQTFFAQAGFRLDCTSPDEPLFLSFDREKMTCAL